MIGPGVVELVALAVVALGGFSVLGVLGFRIFEKLLASERWEPDELSAGGRSAPGADEVELMRHDQRWLGDRLTAVERRLPGLRKPLEGDPVDRLLERLPDVDDRVRADDGGRADHREHPSPRESEDHE